MFREAFKYYKSKQPPPDLSKVLTISQETIDDKVQIVNLLPCGCNNETLYGLNPSKDWKVFTINKSPGLIIIKNPFTPIGQRYWISRCLQDFSKKPYKLNIDIHDYLTKDKNWWDVCTADTSNSSLINKLRWSTLGYHHNWDTKIYSESSKGPFPDDLANLCKHIANLVGFEKFIAQAAIVNYYHMNSTLSGHTDHSEQNLEAPLFSISFGQSAIFLIGGPTENCPALPILIESGDILIMSKESRLCYHAVPKILPSTTSPWNEISNENSDNDVNESDLLEKCKIENFWKPFNDYINTSRLNINVRQVLKDGQKTLDVE